jgi:hypothetical protein
MINRSQKLADWLEGNPSNLPTDRILLSTKLTFQAIFGEVWFGSEKPESNVAGLRKINSQIRKLFSSYSVRRRG